ncbi:hypothetical protein [Acinetobacter sp. NIPH 2699]|uniref:hypothetical protein n=1 Tax=Acinetobacter sp. NIPH 2699 TaxID=2923433 RepID=UPI001F4AAEFC|nr:hypothetical protein [Acinetobacter sp. NIPH 2699]MCH7337638.1 hypothetical protein [Acinetobacter sp. NIPH 2699]
MAKNYTLYPIKIIKDWHGEDWNVYEEKRLANGLMLYKGRLNEQVYGNNTGHILTPEFADYIKQNRSAKILYLAEQLECSKSVLMRFKRELGIQREMHIPDYEWVYAHQNELFVESFETLFEKYGLTKKQVQGYVVHLRKCKGISRTHRRRALQKVIEREKMFLQHKDEILYCNTIVELAERFNVDISIARDIHLRMCAENQLPITGIQQAQRRKEKKQWLLDNKDLLLNSEQTDKSLAMQLNMTLSQLQKTKAYVRKELGIIVEKKVPDYGWVKQHQFELENLKQKEIQELFQITKGQVAYRRNLLKKLKQQKT